MNKFSSNYEGAPALQKFLHCLNSFFQDDATGKAYAVQRTVALDLTMGPLTGCALETIAQDAQEDPSRLLDYAMIVIDSGNRHGDSWKAIFHPKQLILNFIREDMD